MLRMMAFMGENYVVVVGGINADIIGTSYKDVLMEDSNPGEIEVSIGGVGRNIAENISRLGVPTFLFSAVGDDMYGSLAIKKTKKAHVDLSNVAILKGKPTPVFLAVNSPDGHLKIGVNDMALCDMISVDYIRTKLDILNNAAAVVLDTNIPQETIEFMAENVTSPLFADTVSSSKAFKLKSCLDKIHTVKMNRVEAEIISGIKISTMHDAQSAAHIIRHLGAKNIYITMGERGVVYLCGDDMSSIPSYNRKVVSTTGCGDAFTAALVYGFINEYTSRNSASAGLAAASICIGSTGAVSTEINEKNLLKLLRFKTNA